jgi:hypothetical protein
VAAGRVCGEPLRGFFAAEGSLEEIVADVPEVMRNFSISAFGFGSPGLGNQGIMFTGLKHWDERERGTQEIVGELAEKYAQQITGGMAFPVPIRPLGQRGAGQDINFVLLGQEYDEQIAAQLRAEWGLDDPIIVQYGRWLGQVLQGNLGYSRTTSEPVLTTLRKRFPPTLELALPETLQGIVAARLDGLQGGGGAG